MHHFTPSMLQFWLKDCLVACRLGTIVPTCSEGIHILCEQTSIHDDKHLYLCDAAVYMQLRDKLTSFSQSGLFFMISGQLSPDARNMTPANITLFESSLPLLSLYNRLQQHLQQFLSWDLALKNMVYKSTDRQQMLKTAASLIDGTLLLVNSGYKLIAAHYDTNTNDPTITELKENGYLSYDLIQAIHQETPVRTGANNSFVSYIAKASQNYTTVHLIHYQGDLVARLCIIQDGPTPNHCNDDLAAILADYIAEYLFSHHGIDFSHNAAFGSLVSDLIEYRLTDPSELDERLRQIRLSIKKYYHLVLVSFDKMNGPSTLPWNYVISQLKYLFPYSDITSYEDLIVMLVRKQKRGRLVSFDHVQLKKVLDHYQGYACISNTSQFLTSLPYVYFQTKDALRIGQKLEPEKRIQYYEDYSMFQMVELAAEAAWLKYGSRNLVHLCNSETIALMKYDKKNGTDLTEVLNVYLQNERNMTEAAKSLFIHRNTMLNKIHKIESIIGSNLDDPNLRHRLMFSHDVLEYMRKYRNEDMLSIKSGQHRT